ncbi:hypothetical protein [Paraburkholderia phosphatilytica]|uniref:hypothetical protein n=1 Tax=Paraburkholderia phosphatilytica TaxID=2282883 RepID=UPI000F602EA7|nr:hypothetical protein [Paraburkholderia phosphatilytica]
MQPVKQRTGRHVKRLIFVLSHDAGVIYRSAIVMVLWTFQPAYAGDTINASNCMGHLGGGGLADFDCYEANSKRLETDSRKTANAIKQARGLSDANKAELDRYMRRQDDVVASCDMAVEFSYAWKIDVPPKTHRNRYDVVTTRCHYSIRKQQSEFLHDLYSINTG